MDRKQFWILISIINVVCGSAVGYLGTKILDDGSGDINILLTQTTKPNILVVPYYIQIAQST
jgi:hypothetical protein